MSCDYDHFAHLTYELDDLAIAPPEEDAFVRVVEDRLIARTPITVSVGYVHEWRARASRFAGAGPHRPPGRELRP